MIGTSKLEHALAHAAAGFYVFPLQSNGKKPPKDMHFKEAATQDEQQIRAWFAHDWNIGIYTGRFGNSEALIVVDVDTKAGKQGPAELLRLELEGFELPDTRTHRTPTNGRHLIYRCAEPVRQGAEVLGPGLDIRSKGGYIVAPGSTIDGKAYAAEPGDVAEAPAWLIERCGRAKQRTTAAEDRPTGIDMARAERRAREYLMTEAPLAVEGSKGDTVTFKIAARLKDLGATEQVAFDLMAELWNPRCSPPWPLDDLREKVRNGFKYGVEPPGAAAPESDFDSVPVEATAKAPTVLHIGSDVEIARAALADLKAQHGDVFHSEGGFWRYDGQRWARIPDGELRRILHRFDGKRPVSGGPIKLSKSKIDSVLHEMAAMAERSGFFAEAPTGINCASGFITFSPAGDPSLAPHSPDHRARHVLPGAWQPGATWRRPGSLLVRLMDGCFAGDEDKDAKTGLLAEIFGAVALGHARKLMKPKAAVLVGPTAENGKSQVLDAARGLVPAEAVASLPPGKFSDERFAAQLIGAMLNATDELSSAQAIASESFKAIVTGEPVTARDVYRPAVTFRPVAQHLFATNTLPTFAGGFDRGVQRRLLVIPFNRTVPQEERVEHIGHRIATEEPELLLAFAVEGASRLVRRRYFAEPEFSRVALRDWILGADPVLAWCSDRAEFDPGARLAKKEAYADFKQWAHTEGFNDRQLPAINNFVLRIKAHDARIGEARNRDLGRHFLNIKLAKAPETELPTNAADLFEE